MTRKAQMVLREALKLKPGERSEIAESLAISVDDDVEYTKSVRESWEREIARRIEEIDSGKVKLIPWKEAQKLLFGRLNAQNRVPSGSSRRNSGRKSVVSRRKSGG